MATAWLRRLLPDGVVAAGWQGPAALALVWVALLAWFQGVDPYHNHFFDRGLVVVANNTFHLLFIPLLAWLVYAPGAVLARRIFTPADLLPLRVTERAILGFGFGAVLWHVGMLVLGVAGLLYAWVGIALCTFVLAATAGQAAALSAAARPFLARHRRGLSPTARVTAMLLALLGCWLLLAQGLYPGGGGDYYTHYFPYYLAALQQHSLTMNEVWYHYWYSKGDGLFFLAMLVTDPMSHALVTSCFVAFAAAAILALGRRLAPGSLWPLCAVSLYLLYYLVNMNRWGGGEFQKSHEIIAALVTLTAWAICMLRAGLGAGFLAMATACVVTIGIVNQPMGLVSSLFFGALGLLAAWRRDWVEFWRAAMAGAAGLGTVLGILLLSYVMTGLPTDQAFGFMLRLANYARLDQVGVLPQIVALAWMHDNLKDIAPPFGLDELRHLSEFMRLGLLWPFLGAAAAAVASHAALRRLPGLRLGSLQLPHWRGEVPRVVAASALLLALLVGLLAVVSLVGGRVQNISYSRLSSFFVPLQLLLVLSCAGLLLAAPLPRRLAWWLGRAVPALLVAASLLAWDTSFNWGARVVAATGNSLRFAIGMRSFAEAYGQPLLGRQAGGFNFGGINPDALAAAQQLPPGTRIWSTNIDSYCMAPGCHIESVMSFSTSPRLDQIMGGTPEQARDLLQHTGLNYFLFSSDRRLLDMLPYSPLFQPSTIAEYLGIKWTNGTSYLLTWKGVGVAPLDAAFTTAYAARYAEPQSPMFLYGDLARYMAESTARLRAPDAAPDTAFTWRVPPLPGTIDVIAATYGESCSSFTPTLPAINMFRRNNATRLLRDACRGQQSCSFKVDVGIIGDPVAGCGKDFAASYRCNSGEPPRSVRLSAEANGKVLTMECASGQ